jgi:putative two-component system response regulator
MTTASKATLLIVDDSPENLLVPGDILRSHYRAVAAISGESALRVAGSQPQPDPILLDVMMPGMDGYNVLSQLQDNPATRGIPVPARLLAIADVFDAEFGAGVQTGEVALMPPPEVHAVAAGA